MTPKADTRQILQTVPGIPAPARKSPKAARTAGCCNRPEPLAAPGFILLSLSTTLAVSTAPGRDTEHGRFGVGQRGGDGLHGDWTNCLNLPVPLPVPHFRVQGQNHSLPQLPTKASAPHFNPLEVCTDVTWPIHGAQRPSQGPHGLLALDCDSRQDVLPLAEVILRKNQRPIFSFLKLLGNVGVVPGSFSLITA